MACDLSDWVVLPCACRQKQLVAALEDRQLLLGGRPGFQAPWGIWAFDDCLHVHTSNEQRTNAGKKAKKKKMILQVADRRVLLGSCRQKQLVAAVADWQLLPMGRPGFQALGRSELSMIVLHTSLETNS